MSGSESCSKALAQDLSGMTLRASLLAEFIETFVVLSVIVLAGPSGALAPVAIGLALTAMVYLGGQSLAHRRRGRRGGDPPDADEKCACAA